MQFNNKNNSLKTSRTSGTSFKDEIFARSLSKAGTKPKIRIPKYNSNNKESFSIHFVLKDILLFGSLGLATFLFIVLFSYSPQDPSFNSVGSYSQIANYGGRTGSWLASLLLYVIGIFAFTLPFGLLLTSWIALKINKPSDSMQYFSQNKEYNRFITSLIGLLLFVVSGSVLAAMFIPDNLDWIKFPYSAGGVLGYELKTISISYLDLLATTLFILFVFITSISIILNTSWLSIFEFTGFIIEKFIINLSPYVKRLLLWLNRIFSPIFTDLLDQQKPKKNSFFKEENLRSTYKNNLLGSLRNKEKNNPIKNNTFANKMMKDSPKKNVSPFKPKTYMPSEKNNFNKSKPKHSNENKFPNINLLDESVTHTEGFTVEQLNDLSSLLEEKLMEFGIQAKVESVQPGPVVTRFEILPAPGIKGSQINNLSKDLARVLSVSSVMVVDVIPGKAVIGIEIPNDSRELVSFIEVLNSTEFQSSPSCLTIALGKDISGKTVVTDIAKMPHLLVAGTTGSGKSVGVNSMILSLLYKASPDDVRMIMIDPKMLELSVYENIPHLLTPVVTDMSDAANALRWCVFEMDRRYQLMAKLGVRNISGFNAKIKDAMDRGETIADPIYQQKASYGVEQGESPPTLEKLPYIVVVVDEFADMIMVVGKEVEQLIARLAQKARAAGIHLILATQRPSVNVITGLIKANIPTRISFMVNTKIDSRTVLDQGGAEQLLGMGDMLFLAPGSTTPRRVHGAFVSDEEVHRVAEFVKSQGTPVYLETITQMNSGENLDDESKDAEQDTLYDDVVAFVIEERKASVSLLQRRFKIGYNRSAKLVDAMENSGIISTAATGNGGREVLVPKSE